MSNTKRVCGATRRQHRKMAARLGHSLAEYKRFLDDIEAKGTLVVETRNPDGLPRDFVAVDPKREWWGL